MVGGKVQHFLLTQPFQAVHKFALHKGDDNEPAAEGEGADIQCGQKQRPQLCPAAALRPVRLRAFGRHGRRPRRASCGLPPCRLCARRLPFLRHCTGGAFCFRHACLGSITCLCPGLLRPCRGLPLLLHTARRLGGLNPPPCRLCARRTLFLRHCTGGAFRSRPAHPVLCRLHRIFRDGRGVPRLLALRRAGAGRVVCVHAASPFFCGGRGVCRAAPPAMCLSALPSSYHLRSHNKNTIILYSY